MNMPLRLCTHVAGGSQRGCARCTAPWTNALPGGRLRAGARCLSCTCWLRGGAAACADAPRGPGDQGWSSTQPPTVRRRSRDLPTVRWATSHLSLPSHSRRRQEEYRPPPLLHTAKGTVVLPYASAARLQEKTVLSNETLAPSAVVPRGWAKMEVDRVHPTMKHLRHKRVQKASNLLPSESKL